MRTIWLVARWEFMCTVRRASFVVALFGLPIAHLGLAALLAFSMRTALDERSVERPIMIVDASGVLDVNNRAAGAVVRDVDEGMDALRKGTVEAIYVLDAEYLSTGKVRSYAVPANGLLQFGRRLEQRERAAAVLRGALGGDDTDRQRRMIQPIVSIDAYRLERGIVTAETPFAVLGVLAGPFGVCFVLALSIFLSSGLLQQAMSAELQNRMLEVMLSIITPAQLLAGKVLGLSAAGLLQVCVYLAIAAFAAPAAAGITGVSISTMIWSAAIFLAGYAFFAVLLAAAGAMVRDAHEQTQFATVCLLFAAVPFFFIMHTGAHSTSTLGRVLTWFPPTAPVALLLRMGSGSVGTVEKFGVLVLIIISAAALLGGTAVLFKERMLSGERVLFQRRLTRMGAAS